MLVNEKYVDDAIFQKTYSDENYRRFRNYGEQNQYYVKDNHEAIISREDLEAVAANIAQRALEKGNTSDKGKYHSQYTFSGRIICGECGGKFKAWLTRKTKVSSTLHGAAARILTATVKNAQCYLSGMNK